MEAQFLERRAVELRGRHVGGDREDRRGIGLRHRQGHDEVGRARAGRGQSRGRPVTYAEKAIRHVSRRLLVARRHQLHPIRSEEHTSELQSLMRISYAVFCLKKKTKKNPLKEKTQTTGQ